MRACPQREGAAGKPHDLTGDAQPDAGALLLGGEERDENALLDCWRNRTAAQPSLP